MRVVSRTTLDGEGRESLPQMEGVVPKMRRFLKSGRGRFAVLLVVVGASSLAVMGSSCAPAPTKPPPPTSQPPAPTGLSIEPTSFDFGTNLNVPHTFTVTNNGPNTSGTLATNLVADDAANFAIGTNNCAGQTLAAGATCTVQASFLGDVGAATGRLTHLVVSSNNAADGEASAELDGLVCC